MAGVGWGPDSSEAPLVGVQLPGRENTRKPLLQGTKNLEGQWELGPWLQMSPPAVPGRVAGTFLTFRALPVDYAMGTRVADAGPLPLSSLECLTSSCLHSGH